MANDNTTPATKTYSVWADATIRVYQDVEASSPQEAYRLAEQNRDGWEFCSDAGDNEYALSEEVMDVATEEFIRVVESPVPTLRQASQQLYDAINHFLMIMDVSTCDMTEELEQAMDAMEAAWHKADGTQPEETEVPQTACDRSQAA